MSDATAQFVQQALLGEAIDQLDGVAVFVWNEERNYVAVNEAACRLVGVGRDQLIGMPVGGLTEEHAGPQLEQVRSGVRNGTLRFTRPDGEVVELDWTTLHTRVAGLPYMVSICSRRDAS
jgi:PAS domain S-box-containing protein